MVSGKHSGNRRAFQRVKMVDKRTTRWRLTILSLIVFLGVSVVLTIAIGPVYIKPDLIFEAITQRLKGETIADEISDRIIVYIRLPRILLGIAVGAGLAVSGAIMQGIFKNPMADPYVIGVSSGAAFGASVAILIGLNISLLAFLSAIGTAFLVYNISKRGGKIPVETLLLSGIAIAAFFSAMSSLVMYMIGEDLHQIIFWLMGGLWAASWDRVLISFPIIALGIFVTMFYAKDMNAMLLGEEQAKHLGIDVETVKKILLIIASSIAGLAVAVSGIIGFIGLIIPHMTRIFVGPDHRILIPSTALVGAILMIWTDAIARTVIKPVEMPIGIITALIGVPFFIYLLIKRKNYMIS